MIKKILRIVISLLGIPLGYGISKLLLESVLTLENNILKYSFNGVFIILMTILFYIITPLFIKKIEKMLDRLEDLVVKEPKETLIIGFVGIIFGIIIAFLLSLPISMLALSGIFETIKIIIAIIFYLTFASIGYRFSIKYKEDILKLFKRKNSNEDFEKKYSSKKAKTISSKITDKVVDTSVLIDGRIKQIVETGFIEGDLIVPNFVLQELQLIADSSDDLKRERGRRGLDIVNDLRNSKKINFRTTSKNYEDTKEVDIKLLKYANETGASVLTNDFNLNKLAIIQNIKVLNINDLANSVKTVVLPGEKMIVSIIKEGKEKNQGLAYLDDGTMIVVEEGKDLIGHQEEVVVSTVLQTAAGKMIFTKIINS